MIYSDDRGIRAVAARVNIPVIAWQTSNFLPKTRNTNSNLNLGRPKRTSKTSQSPSRPVANPAQSRAFLETAREIEADETKSAADALMGELARTPADQKKKPTPKGRAKKDRK